MELGINIKKKGHAVWPFTSFFKSRQGERMKWPCWIVGHQWRFMNCFNYWDTSYGGRAPSYNLSWMCKKCRKTKEKTCYGAGWLEEDQIKKIKEQEKA